MILSIASGKGGTGKTTLAVSLALALDNTVLLDCDIEEPNVHLFVQPEIRNEQRVEVPAPRFIKERCTGCGKCVEFCQFNALALIKDEVLIFRHLCHNCGGCTIVCPENALPAEMVEIGRLYKARGLGGIDVIWGAILPHQVRGTKLISEVKKNANPSAITIIDCPPGTAHPMVKAVDGSDFCLLVTEPTLFGLNDLKLSVETLRLLDIPCGIVVNRSNLGNIELIEDYARKENIPILMKIPYSREFAEAYSRGTITLAQDSQWVAQARQMLQTITELRSHPQRTQQTQQTKRT
ncbi:ATP-binding protein [Candidatus Sumerlaeota bacterium]|nr:ATP-binding protein [Candidatus Sumerlaeota bacterium]